MLVLGIESSCDETSAALVADGKLIKSNIVASQIATHARFGGVVPELASREHLRRIVPVVDEALLKANASLHDIDAVAVTEGPGLIGSLLVGLVYGKALAMALTKPLVGVNHLEGHIHSVLLQNTMDRREGDGTSEIILPAVALVVSGGHTSLFLVRRNDDSPKGLPAPFLYTQLGQTRDDAAGEAFDKVAKLLALGYPGGPIIDRLARFGNPDAVEFGRIRMKHSPLDFSFSGLKTGVLYRVRGTSLEGEAENRRACRRESERPTPDQIRDRCSAATLDLIASFQRTVIVDLVERTLAAADEHGIGTVLVSGGVACNSELRAHLRNAAKQRGVEAFFPSPALSTDNAAMIAAAGYYRIGAGMRAGAALTARASFPLAPSYS